MIHRRPDRVRHRPEWASMPLGEPVWEHLPVTVPVGRGWIRKVSTAMALVGAVGFLGWLVLKAPDQGTGGSRPAPKPATADVVVTVPEAVTPTEDPTEVVAVDQALPTTSIPTPPQPPSVGMVAAGEMGGKGNGTPGLDLGLEAGGEGLAVAAGGGGKGNGAGSGIGNGVGSQRFVYQLGQVDQDARPDHFVDPAHPRRAQEDGVEAAVECRILVDEHGRVEQIEVLGAPPGYGFESALKTVSQKWRFKPAQLGGVPVPQWVRMPYTFHLE